MTYDPVEHERQFRELEEQRESIEERIQLLPDGRRVVDLLAEYEREPLYDELYRAFGRSYRHSIHPVRIPCGASAGWRVDGVGTSGVALVHDCRDHGHDIQCHESFTLPALWLVDPASWRASTRARIDAELARRAGAEEAEERALYRMLKAKYGSAE